MTDNTPSEAAKAIELWFFRDISDEQRGQLIALCLGRKVADEAKCHNWQRICLKRIIKNLPDRHLPAAEPVAWMYERNGKVRIGTDRSSDMLPAWTETPLYATPPATVNSDAIPEISLPLEMKALSADDIVYHDAGLVVSAKNALKIVLDEAEARDFDPPANHMVVAELEYLIAALARAKGDGA